MTNAIFSPPLPRNEPVYSYGPDSKERAEVKDELERQAKAACEVPLVIGGKHLTTAESREMVSPHNKGQSTGKYYLAQGEEIKAAIAAAKEARREWAVMPWEDRAAIFLKAADLLATKYRPIINAATMLGQSKTIHQAEIDATCELADFFRFNVHYMRQIYSEQPSSSCGMWNRLEARGLEGFVYAITPFNFTSIAVNLPTAPALMGCTVVWKPARTSMLSSYIGMQLLEEAGLPKGVINMISGNSAQITETILQDSDLSGIHFTGSTEVFNSFWTEIGKNIGNYKTYPRIVGETGGKDFIFAHNSCDIDNLVNSTIRGAFEYQGQKCSAASRAYIPKSIWPKVRERLVALTNAIAMGDPKDFSNFMGAVIDKAAFDKISSYIDHASKSSEATIIAGGEYCDEKGYFIRPTIIEVTNPHFKSMTEEIFGPVLTIYPYDDAMLDQTLELCDTSTQYALTGAVFAKDRGAINYMSHTLRHAAGNFYINDKPTGAVVGQQPFGGSRASGTNDKAGSMFNLLRWVSQRTIKESFIPLGDYKYPFMAQK